MNLKKLSYSYIFYLLVKNSIDTSPVCGSSNFVLNKNNKIIKVVYALKTEHKTKRNKATYTYNIWEVNNLEDVDEDFLIVLLYDNLEDFIKELGVFILPRDIVLKIRDKKSITFFESDLTGNYVKEPKINKHFYFNNFDLLKWFVKD